MPGGHAGRQIVELAHLGAGRGQQRLLAAAAAHRAGAQVGDERPGAEDRRVAGAEQVDVDQARQHLGDLLHDRAGERRRAGGAGLARGQQQHRHAGAHRGLEAAAGIGGELERRHDEAAGHRDERPRPPRRLAAGDQMQHRDRLVDVLGLDEARADVLAVPAMQA